MQTAIQLYTLRNLSEAFEPTARRVADAGFDGVEFAGLDGDPDEVARTLEAADLSVAGAHVSLEALEDEYATVLERYATVGCDRFVVPSYPLEAFESREGVDEAAERLSAVAGRLADDGRELHYHNHAFEFGELGERTAFDRLVERSSDQVQFEIDTGLARHGGVDPAALLDRYGDRVALVHFTDTRPGSTETHHVDLGEGVLDLETVADAVRRTDPEWVVAENGRTEHPLETLENAAETMDRLFAE